jgi:dihydroorotase-like cyclic amidohydrolase
LQGFRRDHRLKMCSCRQQELIGKIHPTRYLIRSGRIYDHDGDIHQPATTDLLIHRGIIERIAPQIAADDGVEVLDAAGKLVVPGFVNAHYHSHDVMANHASEGIFPWERGAW